MFTPHLLALLACTPLLAQDPVPSLPPARTVVVFGDSITEAAALRDQAWLRVVERESEGALKMVNEGKGGRACASVPELEKMFWRHPRIDHLVIALGTNDSRDITAGCVPKAMGSIRKMVERARATYGPALPVLLVGPPNINKAALVASKPIAHEREAKLRELGDGFEKLAKEIGCDYVSTFGVVPEASMSKDGVHPDAAGHQPIARAILKKLIP